MENKLSLPRKTNLVRRGSRFTVLLLVCVLIFSLIACGEEPEGTASPEKMDITGLYEGAATVTKANNDTLGSVKDMSFHIVQNDNQTATISINDNIAEGSYNPETGEFYMEHGFVWNLVFAREEGTITAKGTMTSEETGQGFTQEVTLDLKRTGD